MNDPEYELRYLKAGIDMLEDYIQSGELYWSIGISAAAGQTPYPQMTLGGLLLFFRMANACEKARLKLWSNFLEDYRQNAQRQELAQLETKMNDIRTRWRTAWGKKATHAFKARLKLWSNFLEDYRQNADANQDRYAYEVSRRVQLQLLQPDADERYEAEDQLLVSLDQFLKAVLITDGFIWDQELADGFPKDPYWYLYGYLKGR